MKTRGPELPGNYNHVLLTELFHYQSKRWPDVASKHLQIIHDRILVFVKKALAHLNLEQRVRDQIWERMLNKLGENKANAVVELAKLSADERGQPITYNRASTQAQVTKLRRSASICVRGCDYVWLTSAFLLVDYYTDTIQKSRTDAVTNLVHRSLDSINIDKQSKAQVKASLTPHVIVNMNERACSEALDDLNAYYKVWTSPDPNDIGFADHPRCLRRPSLTTYVAKSWSVISSTTSQRSSRRKMSQVTRTICLSRLRVRGQRRFSRGRSLKSSSKLYGQAWMT